MEKAIGEYFLGLEMGQLQAHKGLSVVPVFSGSNGGPLYQTMKEGLGRGTLTVTEVSAGGSVPDLKVVNQGELQVLLLDGEELAGAKQNRVLNTTILVDAHSEVVIPVSCTEYGRWSYTSNHFGDSDVIMASRIRRQKARSVTNNLKSGSMFRSDQGAVWDGIHEMAAEAGVASPTGAMRDVFESREGELDGYLGAMSCSPGQKGMIALINGLVVGLDCVSLDTAYALLHAKLIKSYAMEAILAKKTKQPKVLVEAARTFLSEIPRCTEKKYKSVGLGWDYRFEADNMVGSALECDGHVIHTAFFPITEAEKVDPMAGYRRRRAYRTQNGQEGRS